MGCAEGYQLVRWGQPLMCQDCWLKLTSWPSSSVLHMFVKTSSMFKKMYLCIFFYLFHVAPVPPFMSPSSLLCSASCFILKLLTLCFQCLCLLQGCFQITCLCIESPVSSSSLLSLLVDLPWSLPSICLCVSSIFSFFF